MPHWGMRFNMVIEQRRRSLVGPIIAVLVVAAVVVVAIVLFAGNDSSDPAKDDVTVQACTADPDGDKPTATGQILNGTSKPSNYVIRLKFLDAPGNQVSEGVNVVNDVEPGATATWKLTGTRGAKGPVRCEVTGVSRTHVPGQ